MITQINFEYKDIKDLGLSEAIKSWIVNVADHFNYSISEINYTFMSDESLLQINRDFLNHNYFTDIITFDNTLGKTISADIAISLDRVRDNSHTAQADFDTELRRVMIHGVLHCFGFKDTTDKEKEKMRLVEDDMLNMFHVEHNKNEL